MNEKYILYNPFAGNGKCRNDIALLETMYENAVVIDMRKVSSYKTLFSNLDESDEIILCGGDGTLNRFINDIKDVDIRNTVFYYPVGSGNDFARDLGHEKGCNPSFSINQYIKGLPTVAVNGTKRLFINGVGYGIDGYCCEVGDKLRMKNEQGHTDKPINYTMIAIKGLLFHYKPTKATVTVDGKKYTYDKVWIAPTMNGRYYGGGMMPTPNQKRLGDNKKLSLMVFHGSGKLRTLMIFPSIFKGEHVKHTKQVAILEGNEITVEFDSPRALQIDGETVLDVRSYTVALSQKTNAKAPELSAVK